MTKDQAKEIVSGLVGWCDVLIEETENKFTGNPETVITASDTPGGSRKRYNPETGFFE